MWWVGESHLLVVEVLAEKERCGGWVRVSFIGGEVLAEKERCGEWMRVSFIGGGSVG